MNDRPDLPWGIIPEERASFPHAGHASDSVSASGRHSKPLQDYSRMHKGASFSRQPSAESDDRASTEYQMITNVDTSGENSGFSCSSGDEAAPRESSAPGCAPSSSRRGTRVGFAREARESFRHETSGLPRSSSSGDVSRVLRPAVSTGAARSKGVSGSITGVGKRTEAASSEEEEQPSLALRRAQTHALCQVFDPASGHASDCDSSIHSERDDRRWLEDSRLRLDGIDGEAASLPSNSPFADMRAMQAASGVEGPAQDLHGAGVESKRKAGFFKGALQAMKRVGRTSKGATELEECLDGTARGEHANRLEHQESLPVGSGAADSGSLGGGGGRFFGRQSSVGVELSGAARRAATRVARKRNQSCDAGMQVPDTVGRPPPQETPPHRRSRVQRVWTCPDGAYGKSSLMSVPEAGSSTGVFQKRGALAGGHYNSLSSLASPPATEISVVSSAMPAMRTAVPPAVVHQIAARSEPVVACQVSVDTTCLATPLAFGLASPRPSARFSAGAVPSVHAPTQAQVSSPFTTIVLPEAALAIASPGASSDASSITKSHPATLVLREAGGGLVGTPVKAAVTPMRAAVTPTNAGVTPIAAALTPMKAMTPGSTAGTPVLSQAGTREEGVAAGAGSESPAMEQRQRWKVLAEEVQDVMIGVLVLVCLCSLFLGKISALVATLAVALLASRTMPPRNGAVTRQSQHKGSLRSTPAKSQRGLQGASIGQNPLLPQAESGGFSGTPKTESVKRQQQIQNILQYSRTTDPKSRHVLEGLLSRPTKTKTRR